MNLTFDLSIVENSNLQIKDTTQEYDEYLPENNNQYVTSGRFKYSDTATINVIKYKYYNEENPVILDVIITNHKQEDQIMYLDEALYQLKQDGHYIIDHLVLPTKEWFDFNVEEHDDYTILYFTDGINFYKYNNDVISDCSIEEIIAVENLEITTISKTTQETFSICFIHSCYLEQCKKQLEQNIHSKCSAYNYKPDFNLDLTWLAINAIKYNIEFGYLNQAQSILEDLTNCTNLCKPEKYKSNGCCCR